MQNTRLAYPRSLTALFFVSLVSLYTEIMLIRWIGTEVRVFAFVQNLALVACFLGFGLGCYRFSRRSSLLRSVAAITGLVMLVQMPVERWRDIIARISDLLTLTPDAALWGGKWMHPANLPLYTVAAISVTALMLLLVVFAMIPFGQWVGEYLNECSHLEVAYAVNLMGSLAGTWAIAALAFLWLPPIWWFVIAFGMIATIERKLVNLVAITGSLLLIALLLRPHAGTTTVWSPYQKLEVVPYPEQQFQIDVNNTGYMSISNLSPEFLQRHPELSNIYRDLSYDSPYRFLTNKDRVLIVGAGAGNDAAAALRSGIKQIDAVEIDPAIYNLGRRLHPEKPYSSPHVSVILDDARSVFRSTNNRYDAIIFGLLDSHTQFSGYTNMRIDNYIYTEEAFREARRLLNPGGVLILKFEVREPWTWMGRRFSAMLNDVFGHDPIVYHCEQSGAVFPATIFIESQSPDVFHRAEEASFNTFLANHPPNFAIHGAIPPVTTDDWPYVYHAGRWIPRTYFTVAVILIVLTLFLVRRDLKPKLPSTWSFFFLGAGFLLLETQLVSRLALYFGSTWIVNCIAISIVLVVLVAATFLVLVRPSMNIGLCYVILVAGLVTIRFLPLDSLGLSVRLTGFILGMLYAVPVFCAGIVFTTALRDEINKSEALGANLVGAVFGGVLQSLSFIVGLKALLLVAAILYVSAWTASRFAGSIDLAVGTSGSR